jgi:proteasome lid subunit RPN8/RPN11
VSWHIARRKLRAVRILIVTQRLFEDVQRHVLGQYPVEACGFLSGRFDGDEAQPERCIVVKNIAESADRFVLDPKECDRVRKKLRRDEELVGFFHSHAKDPEPSGLDKLNMRFLPLVWLIVGGVENGRIEERECMAFKRHLRETQSVELRVVPEIPSRSKSIFD